LDSSASSIRTYHSASHTSVSSISGGGSFSEAKSYTQPHLSDSTNFQEQLNHRRTGEGPPQSPSRIMNQTQPYMDVHQSHLSSAQSYAPQSATAGGMAHYQYSQPVMQPNSASYAPSPSPYPQYGYPNGVTSPQSATQPSSNSMGNQLPAQLLPLPGMGYFF
jgi:protein SOK2